MQKYKDVRFLNRSTPPHILTLILLASISALTMNIFLPSLPNIASELNSSTSILGLSVGIYLASSAVLQLIIGPFSDQFGRRPLILWSLIIFCISTLATVFVTNTAQFLILRIFQAISASCMVLARAIVRDTTESIEKAGSKIAYVTMGMALVPMVGPAIGGLLDYQYGWEASFWLLFILGLVILIISFFDVGETLSDHNQSFLEQISTYPSLLRSKRFWGYCLSSAFVSGAFFSYLGGAPFVGNEVFGLEPKDLGFWFGAPAIGYVLGNFLSGRFSTKIGLDKMIFLGVTIALFGVSISLTISLSDHGSVLSFFGLMTLVGLGNGMSIPNATAAMMSINPKLAGTAAGLGSAIMIGGGAGLSAIANFILIPGSSEIPLIMLMWTSVFCGLCSVAYVNYRKKTLEV
ncbi:MAG: Bcr/CflA family drug resistance efflux transporter [Rhodobacteraceae bacterium TMED111]|nr:Bcr/CflA family drug resistance efflux transporter [Marinovum sp.]OUV40956.1 MAG: Bcr/CflA family drug resistance efflux transporter [Rhodobacteraceae bacterium TMED111]